MPNKLTRFCEGLMEAGWLAAILLAPLFFNLYSSRIFEPDKIALIRSIALVMLGAWIVKLIDQRGFYWDRVQPEGSLWKWFLKVPLVLWVAGLVAAYLVATIFSVTPSISFWGSYQRLQGTYSLFSYLVIFVTILGNMRKRAQVERLITAAILSSLPITLYGFLQRFKLDPVPWGGDTVRRIATTAGNSIFAGAYIIMVSPLTLMRAIDALRGILKGSSGSALAANIIRGSLYIFLWLVQVIALYMTGSRGPMLGFITGLVFFGLLVFFIRRWRMQTAVLTGLVGLLLAFLVVFQIPGGPFEALRKSPAVGRFGALLDAESNSAKVRRYIWEGAADLISPHDPLYYPNGSRDALNLIRPLIGYGPESMYVAFNQFYIPELGQVERRNASPDRSHNETWDYLVQTGIFGLVVYIGLFVSVFYYGLKYLGMMPEKRYKLIYLGLAGAGGLVGAVGLALWREVAYFGVGMPLGILAGTGLFILYFIFFGPKLERPEGKEQEKLFILAALLSAIVGHYVEINFGIAIAATRTYFWAFAGALIVVGWLLPLQGEFSDTADVKAEAATSDKSKRAVKRSGRSVSRTGSSPSPWMRDAFAYGGTLGLMLMSMAYGFILNSANTDNIFAIIWNALAKVKKGDVLVSGYGLLGLFAATLVLGGLLLAAETLKGHDWTRWKQVFVTIFSTAGIMMLAYMIWHAMLLSGLVRGAATAQGFSQIDRLSGILTWLYIYIGISLAVIAWYISTETIRWRRPSVAGMLAAVSMTIVLMLTVYFTNLRIVHADITFKMAESYNQPTRWATATAIYQHASQQAPSEDHYYLFLARSYMEQAKETTDPAEIEALIATTEADLIKAQQINPLNTDHTANLARLYNWYTAKSTTAEERNERSQKTYDYYATALKLSPQNSTLWGEWASMAMQVMNRPDEAYDMIQTAINLDPKYAYTQGLAARYWMTRANAETDAALKSEYMENAAEFYLNGARVARTTERSDKLEFFKQAGSIYYQLGMFTEAIAAFEELLDAKPDEEDVWAVEESIARIYLQMDDRENALIHAQAALEVAPADKTAQVEQLIAEIQAVP